MSVTNKETEKAVSALAHIAGLTGAKVRVFLTEITEGVSSYRSMHSLTQQVEHQYHGRFLIELLQNAHDAFSELSYELSNRVEIVFDPNDSPHGSLLVANDGQPFSPSNFERLSQLGQSDKDPQKSIGNKGIGFRSVLEISDCPEVYSRRSPSSPSYDGYCFAFRPDVVKSLVEPIKDLSSGDIVPVWSITGRPIVENWSNEMLSRFRKRADDEGIAWLVGETNYLSPYLLPVPLTEVESNRVIDFESRGFATVVRLPLKSQELRDYVLERMAQLSGATLLFLEMVGTLRIVVFGGDERVFTRSSATLEEGADGKRVSIADSSGMICEYGVWKTDLHVPNTPQEFRNAVAKLPGRWPEITDISVSVAVRLLGPPEAGKFSIYLPTLVPTGSAAYVNAPFFGDMSRTSIPFDDAYNRQLLEAATDLALDVVCNKLAGKGEVEACAIIDLLAPFGKSQAALRWHELMEEAAARASAYLHDEALALAEGGWKPLNETSLIPASAKVTVLDEEALRRHASFNIFHRCLDSRTAQIKDLATEMFGEVGAYPTQSDMAETIASVASELHASGGDWNEFWRDVAVLLPSGQAELAKHPVLIGGDGSLHRPSEGKKVFFVPRQGTQDDSDIGGDSATTEVPSSLRASVAFLSDQIQVYDPNRPTVQTAVRVYLGTNGLVSPFRIETIFAEVLQKLIPPLPAPIQGEHFQLCRDILGWATRLIANVIARGRATDATFGLLRNIPVPCIGGWYPMNLACMGEGWPATVGDALSKYLKNLNSSTSKEARNRLLLPPSHPAWGNVGPAELSILISGGVLNGLPLFQIKPEAWDSKFQASASSFQLPGPPPSVSAEQWSKYVGVACSEIRPPFIKAYPYEVGSIMFYPGMFEFLSLGEDERLALSDLIIQSLPEWGKRRGLNNLPITKQGGLSNRLEVPSPLMHFLQTEPWMAIRDIKGLTWGRPAERWYVPADTLAGRSRHYAHLKALPVGLARDIGMRTELATILRKLGMHFFDPHSSTENPELLEALCAAIGSDEVADVNVLLGQFRDAWQHFRPAAAQPPMKELAVRRKDKHLSAMIPTIESPAYLPDSAAYVAELEELDFPIVAIWPSDAKDLREWFANAYSERVQLTSALSLVPNINDKRWTGSGAVALADSDLGWLIKPMLVMVATQGRGVHSPAFKERLAILQAARVDWVPNLSVAVMRNETRLANTEVKALWEPQRKTLVAAVHCRMHLEELSGALAQALERDDLELPLRFLLRNLGSVEDAPEDVVTFLAPLRISPEQVYQVLEHLRGDIGHMSRLIGIFLSVISPSKNLAELQASATEEDLAAALDALAVPGLDASRVLQIARDSQDLFAFGRAVSLGLGKVASLSRWNAELAQHGHPPLVNRNWQMQLQANLEEAAALVKRIAVHAICRGTCRNYLEMWNQYQGLNETPNLGDSHWTVTFNDAMHLVAEMVESWLSDSVLIDGIRSSGSVDELRLKLAAVGVMLDADPDECGRKNHELVDALARGIDRLRLALWLRTTADQSGKDWQPLVDQYKAGLREELAGNAFVREWSEAETFSLVKCGMPHDEIPEFQEALEASSGLESLRDNLKLSAEELSIAENRLDAIRSEQKRRRTIVNVCGVEFDGSEENLEHLWRFLSEHLPDAELSKSMSFDLAKPASLAPIKKRPPSEETEKKPKKKTPRQTKAVEELVGLAGEMHVFRMLRQNFGEEAVSSSAWISENSKKVFPFNECDDTKGCDFSFTAKGKQFRVEVKASSGDDESFKLGSSEIRLAMEIGTKRKRSSEIFLIVHVRNALSTQPSAIVLSNPYDPKCNAGFRLEEADARVRYHIQKQPA